MCFSDPPLSNINYVLCICKRTCPHYFSNCNTHVRKWGIFFQNSIAPIVCNAFLCRGVHPAPKFWLCRGRTSLLYSFQIVWRCVYHIFLGASRQKKPELLHGQENEKSSRGATDFHEKQGSKKLLLTLGKPCEKKYHLFLMSVVKSDHCSMRNARMSRTDLGNHGSALRAMIASKSFAMSSLLVT